MLAQIPTITAVSRQALISGRRPAEFSDTVHHNRAEKRRWKEYWARHDLSTRVCAYEVLDLGYRSSIPNVLTSSRQRALCLVNSSLDDKYSPLSYADGIPLKRNASDIDKVVYMIYVLNNTK